MSIKVTVVGDSSFAQVVRDAIHVAMPHASVAVVAREQLHRRVEADLLVLDGRIGGATVEENARLARATGFANALLVVGDDESESSDGLLNRIGAQRVGEHDLARELLAFLTDYTARISDTEGEAARASVARAQRLIAAGEIALGLQHALNNPLAGLLAEEQLLEMEDLPAEQKLAVKRMIDLTRRLVALVRELDGVSSRRA